MARGLPSRALQTVCFISVIAWLPASFMVLTGLDLPVKESFPKPGRYSLRVIYKSWLRKEFIAPQLRDLPTVWADTPGIVSEPLRIEIQENSATKKLKP
jgi:hypothetical protein